jgi:hypothetical protein
MGPALIVILEKERQHTLTCGRALRLKDPIAFVVDRLNQALDPAAVRRQKDALADRLLVAEATLGDLKCEELDVEAILAFAAPSLENAGRLWQEADPPQRQQLARVLFPAVVTFDGQDFHTPVSASAGNDLQGFQSGSGSLVDLTGIEPVTS